MPRIKTNRRKPPPEGYEFIQETIDDLNRKMREGGGEEGGETGLFSIRAIDSNFIFYIYEID